jgi:predicted transcriptional regulator
MMDLPPREKSHLQESKVNNNKKADNRYLVLNIISYIPGIRYRELLRLTKFNNGTLSYHLLTLEKHLIIKVLRLEKGNITRYYPYLTPVDEALIVGYLRIKTSRQILMLLHSKRKAPFSDIVKHISKAPSTTWNLKRLLESNIIIKKKSNESWIYSLKNPKLVEELINRREAADTLLERSVDNYISLIDNL